MTVLPIVERELLVTSRRPGTYWLRFWAAAAGLALFLTIWLLRNSTLTQLGHQLFLDLGSVALTLAMLSGVFLTADALAAEKREATLGLLFLTDLKGYDVVLGKLAASSLHALFALLAVFPILAMPLLSGGLAFGEFWRLMIVFVATLYLSLGIGMFVSATSREGRQAMVLTLVIVAAVAGVLPALWQLLSRLVPRGQFDFLLWPSPVCAFLRGFDSAYAGRFGVTEFWCSIATILFLGTAALVAASVLLPRVWQRGANLIPRKRSAGIPLPLSTTASLKLPATPVQVPFYWLTLRLGESRRPARLLFWVFLPLLAIFMTISLDGSKSHTPTITAFFIAMGLHITAKILMAAECSRRFHHDRHTGALELLLVTPLPTEEILSGQRAALWALFKRPIWALCLINGVMAAWILLFCNLLDMQNIDDQLTFVELFLGGAIALPMDFAAMTWAGMWIGLNARSHSRAVFRTVLQIMLPSWLAIFLLMAVEPNVRPLGIKTVFALWFAGGIIIDIINMRWAAHRLPALLRAVASGTAGSLAPPFQPMKNLTSPHWIKFKGILFLVVGLISALLLVLEAPTLKVAALLAITIWCFCRFYYFAFYVIEHYVDPAYRFSGLGSFVKYLLRGNPPKD